MARRGLVTIQYYRLGNPALPIQASGAQDESDGDEDNEEEDGEEGGYQYYGGEDYGEGGYEDYGGEDYGDA